MSISTKGSAATQALQFFTVRLRTPVQTSDRVGSKMAIHEPTDNCGNAFKFLDRSGSSRDLYKDCKNKD